MAFLINSAFPQDSTVHMIIEEHYVCLDIIKCHMKSNVNKFKVEVWSDVTCVHCYMAKRNFERALSQTDFKNDVHVTWRSFELVPGLKVTPRQNMYEFLAEYNKASIDQVKQVCSQIINKGKLVGIGYNFDVAIPANSFRAHMLSQFAKEVDLQTELEEALLRAHFIDGENIDDVDVLTGLAAGIGIDKNAAREALDDNKFADLVKRDIIEAQQRGINGVPYYLFNSKHSLYGSHDSARYKEVLEASYTEWSRGKIDSPAGSEDGSYCEIGKKC
jgi:predicted DsbA family dithiol-disulfide isomerase